MDVIRGLAGSGSSCRIATPHDAVQNGECCYTFHTPYTTPDQGILVNLNTFAGTVQDLAMVNNNGGNGDDGERQLFVRIVKKRVEKEKPMEEDGEGGATTSTAAAAPTKLGIGVEGGFQSDQDKYDTISTHSVVVLEKSPSNQPPTVVVTELPYSDETKSEFPEMVARSVDSVLCHAGTTVQQDVKVWQLDADEQVPVSKYANAALPYVDNGVKIPPNPGEWKCQRSGATDNLWLNLSTGYIGGGRKNWDGSGGSNGALDHFEETGKLYPLVVKLGTITSDLDTADCYSYAPDEDGPVKIPNLQQLLEKRGIRAASLQKTVKSTAELEVELNANYAFDAITESGAELTPVSGPGLQGLQNLGNSCYMNSVLQMLLGGTVPELAARYGTTPRGSVTAHPFLTAVAPPTAPNDVLCQTAKVACALTSGAFARPVVPTSEEDSSGSSNSTDPMYRLAPRMFKHLIGKDHVDFRTGQQQDAPQFLQYLLERLDRAEHQGGGAGASASLQSVLKKNGGDGSNDAVHVSSHLFSHKTMRRLACQADGKVKYKEGAPETIWSLRIPMDKATIVAAPSPTSSADKDESPSNKDEGDTDAEMKSPEHKRRKSEEKEPKPTISFYACVDEWAKETTVEGIRWPHLHDATHPATERLGLATCPRYLIVQMQRYTLGPDWVPIKLEVNLDIPEEIDLSPYKSTGAQDGEDLVPDEGEGGEAGGAAGSGAAAPSAAQQLDETALGQLMDMGFTLNSCKRALTAVGGSDVESAMTWVFEHNTDPDFNDPLPEEPSSAAGDSAGGDGVDEAAVQSLVEMLGCFTADQVRAALKETNGASDRAADWLFSHMDDLDGAIAALQSKGQESAAGGGGGGDSSATASAGPALPLDDGPGKYVMVGMISHIGKNTGSGHYVAHLKKKADGNGIDQWVIFNDEKVALSSHPPKEHAYVYLFQRKDTIGSPHPNY